MRPGESHGVKALAAQRSEVDAVLSVTGTISSCRTRGAGGVRVAAFRARMEARFPPLRLMIRAQHREETDVTSEEDVTLTSKSRQRRS